MDSVSPHTQRRSDRPSNRARTAGIPNGMTKSESVLLSMTTENCKPKTVMESTHESSQMKLMHHLAGRSVLLRQDELLRLAGQAGNSITQDRKAFQSSIEKRTDSIMRSWKELRDLKNAGKFSECREIWMRMAQRERKAWLRRNFPKLPEHAHSYIYAWLQCSKLQTNAKFPLYRLLNIDTLSKDNVLMELLEIRATLHPRYLLDMDGRSVFLGICCGSLPSLRVSGVLRLPLCHADDKYEFVWDENGGMMSHLTDTTPGLGIHILGAQDMVYSWLAKCPQHLIQTSMLDLSNQLRERPEEYSTSPLPLLTRSLLSDYREIYNHIDLAYLDSLLMGALDESLFDLAQARRFPDVWHEGLKRKSWTAACGTWFARVDIFTTLSNHLKFIKQREGNSMILKRQDCSFKLLAAFNRLLESMVEEVLCQLPRRHWLSAHCGSLVLSSLLRMLEDNDPMLQVMPIVDAMTVIDIELKKAEPIAHIPRQVVQTLNGLSVIGACQREVEKHYKFAEDVPSYVEMLVELEKKSKSNTRPWKILFEAGMHALDKGTAQKLDTHIRDQTIELQLRHHNFWKVVDGALASAADETTQAVLNKILAMSSRDAPFLSDGAQKASFGGPVTLPEVPTRTQLNRSKRQTARPVTELAPLLLIRTPEADALPVINLRTQKEFWNTLLAQSSESRSDLKWDDFCAAMMGIGFEIHPQLGSCYRFYSEQRHSTIVFHKPHPRASLPHTIARRQWLDRLKSRFTLVL